MSVYSMTGYACSQQEIVLNDASNSNTAASANPAKSPSAPKTVRLGIELRSVNSRFLDLNFKMPEELRQYERTLRELIGKKIKRGKIEFRLFLERNEASFVCVPQSQQLQKLNDLQNTILSCLPNARPLSVAEVIQLSNTENHNSSNIMQILSEQALFDCVSQMANALLAARAREGERLALMLENRIEQLRTFAKQAEPLIPQLVEQQRQRFLERWQEAMQLAENNNASTSAANERALTEATAFAIRIDVAEEITRIHSHLDEILRLLQKGGEIGKRLDFLIQELHREANTFGSKSSTLELTHISVNMKVLIEQMREQVQNIE